jgi:hypothetical protein
MPVEKTELVKFRLESDIKAEIEKIADAENRTTAGQIRMILKTWWKNRRKR